MLFITYPSNDTLAEDFLLSQLYQQNQGLTYLWMSYLKGKQNVLVTIATTICWCTSSVELERDWRLSWRSRCTCKFSWQTLCLLWSGILHLLICNFRPLFIFVYLYLGSSLLIFKSRPLLMLLVMFIYLITVYLFFSFSLRPNIELVLQFASPSLSML